jgi:hypothetical protein
MSLKEINTALLSITNQYSDSNSLKKILNYISKDLNEKMEQYWERKKRQEELIRGSELYISDFLTNSDTKYVYIGNSNIFLEYKGEEFKLVNESEILHNILTGISQNKILLPWKHKIKCSIMKTIKEQEIFDIIPESYTIQFVLNYITPLLMPSKDEAKYFLTVLGDNILKKNSDKYHLLDIGSKDFITALEENVFHYFKHQHHLNNTFKYNWYDHEYSKCRIITFNKSVQTSVCWKSFVKYHILDIVSVAVHYSNRYGDSEEFILSKYQDNPLLKNILYLKDTTQNDIVDAFINESIIKVDDPNIKVSWSEIYYIWKVFLAERNLPHIIFIKSLKKILMTKLNYNIECNHFENVSSKQLSFIKNLELFWRENIYKNESDEFEVSELCDIYNDWLKTTTTTCENQLSEKNMITLLEHFYNLKLSDTKSFGNIGCTLWNKQGEMSKVINNLKLSYKFSPEIYNKSLCSIYQDYCSTAKHKFNFRSVSKKYFEKYITQVIPEKYIIRKRIINDYWVE